MQRRTEEFQLAVQEYLDVDWSNVKYYFRKQIAKCVNECKSQASNAKRIVGTIRHHKSKEKSSEAPVQNGDLYDSDDDFDYWDSDFDEDFEDELNEEIPCPELCSSVQCSEESKDNPPAVSAGSPVNNSDGETHHTNGVLKASDAPAVSPTFLSSQKTPQRNNIPRPPLKRPASQPPPPPVVTQLSSTASEPVLEDYEIPINHSGGSVLSPTPPRSFETCSRSSSHSEVSSITETYEVIEPPEENYEIVASPIPPLPVKTIERPILPPRLAAAATKSCAPPPLPQKPKKWQEARDFDKIDICRPKLPIKQEDDSANDISSVSGIGSAILNSFLGRKSSSPSPKLVTRSRDLNCSDDSISSLLQNTSVNSQTSMLNTDKEGVTAFGGTAFLNSAAICMPSETVKSLLHLQPEVNEVAVNSTMASRPLPPVPLVQKDNSSANMTNISTFPWFHEIERHDAEEEIQKLAVTGAFLVRPSRRAGRENPYTLTCLHDGKVFHLNIRQRSDGTFALGKEKKKEKTFPNVPALISFHQNDPILLTSRGESAGQTILRTFPPK